MNGYKDIKYVRKIPFYSKVSYENVWINAINDCRDLRVKSPTRNFPDAVEALKMTLLQDEKKHLKEYIETGWKQENETLQKQFEQGNINKGEQVLKSYTLLFEKIIEILETAGFLLKTTTLMTGGED